MKRILILALLSVVASAGNSQQTVDVSEFGKFAAYSSTTASTTLGQPIAYLDGVQSFKNGEYVTIFHAGRRFTLSSGCLVRFQHGLAHILQRSHRKKSIRA
jgi:hypothetical protein